jgi:hypothetical protein
VGRNGTVISGGKRFLINAVTPFHTSLAVESYTRSMKHLLICCLLPLGAFAQGDFKLPPPFATPSARNNSKVVPRPTGAEPKAPAGFVVEEYLSDFARPRFMILGPNKELVIADSAPNGRGSVYVVEGKQKKKILEGLDRPYGLAF